MHEQDHTVTKWRPGRALTLAAKLALCPPVRVLSPGKSGLPSVRSRSSVSFSLSDPVAMGNCIGRVEDRPDIKPKQRTLASGADVNSQDCSSQPMFPTAGADASQSRPSRVDARSVGQIKLEHPSSDISGQAPAPAPAPVRGSPSGRVRAAPVGWDYDFGHVQVKLVSKLGRGNFGKVYLVRAVDPENPYVEPASPRYFAMKEVSTRRGHDLYATMELEILSATAATAMPHMVHLHGYAQEGQVLRLLMTYVPGRNLLGTFVKYGSLPESSAQSLVLCILWSLRFLHQAGLVHRDIKPENILVQSTSSSAPYRRKSEPPLIAKLCDFGLAKRASASDRIQRTAGTIEYSSPEQLEPARLSGYWQPADIWALGCVAYCTLTAQHPFYRPTDDQAPDPGPDNAHGGDKSLSTRHRIMRARILKGEPFPMQGPQWSHVSAEAKDFICRCLEYNPCDRITADQALLHPWLQGLSFAHALIPPQAGPPASLMASTFSSPPMRIPMDWSAMPASGPFSPAGVRSSRVGSPAGPMLVSPVGAAAVGVDLPVLPGHVSVATQYSERSNSRWHSMASRASRARQSSYGEAGLDDFMASPGSAHVVAPRFSTVHSQTGGFVTGAPTSAMGSASPGATQWGASSIGHPGVGVYGAHGGTTSAFSSAQVAPQPGRLSAPAGPAHAVIHEAHTPVVSMTAMTPQSLITPPLKQPAARPAGADLTEST